MKVVELSRDEFFRLLCNPSPPVSQGQFGIASVVGDKLYKVNYKDFIEAYNSKNVNDIDSKVSFYKSLKNQFKNVYSSLYSTEERLKKYERLEQTKSNKLITGVLSYDGIFVGVEMTYFQDYVDFGNFISNLNKDKEDICINKICDLILNLLENGIVPEDISEDNILVNPITLDVVLIDLDDDRTKYRETNYVRNNILVIGRQLAYMYSRLDLKNYELLYGKYREMCINLKLDVEDELQSLKDTIIYINGRRSSRSC